MHALEPVELDFLESLNPDQKEAVTTLDGPLLVLAGAGTGKTKVLTSRIANILLSRKAFPSQILAVTFTNKAAKEMKNRVEKLIGGAVEGLWLGTFHSVAARILRKSAELVGLRSDFTIIDIDDQLRLLKQILADLNIDNEKNTPKLISYQISRLKDRGITPNRVTLADNVHYGRSSLTAIYQEYQKRLINLNAVDFGDLLLYNIEIFNKNLELLQDYQNRFRYILVDEYQDTNTSQYIWLRLLAQGRSNICCVGDDDQSIYGWRGAVVSNILSFDKDFVDAKIIRLQQNYRSTTHILTAATKLIANNKERHGKTLWTADSEGEKVKVNSFYDDREEARYIVDEIDSLRRFKSIDYSEMAILVRAGYQTRTFEEALNFLKVPYRIVGGLKFYERAEIKDVLAYIRVLNNENDSLAFERILNVPRRGIGATTIQKLQLISREQEISLLKAAKMLLEHESSSTRSAQSLATLIDNFKRWRQLLSTLGHSELVDLMLQEVGYIEMWKTNGTEDSRERIDNIKELVRSLQEYDSLTNFLEHISLVTDSDNVIDENVISVMTMHAAKGLEFIAVFLPGWEESIFPSQRSIEESGNLGLEEERRLAYVAITRAKQKLYITSASTRRMYGYSQASYPSRFLDELDAEHVEDLALTLKAKRTAKIEEIIDQSSVESESGLFKKGMRVFHNKFGYGIISSVMGNTAQVTFDKAESKKVMLDYLKAVPK